MSPLARDAAQSRIIDASLNRAAEALRVAEDICRFAWSLPGLAAELRELRHSVLHAFAPGTGDRAALAARRDIEDDVGRAGPEPVAGPRDLPAAAIRNLERAKEALRTLEEVARLSDPASAAAVGALRYRLYSIEKGVLALAGGRSPTRLDGVSLYLLASGALARSAGCRELVDAVEAAIAGGAGAVQLREKATPDREVVALGRGLRELTARAGVLLIVNDRPDLALVLGADGVHLGQGDLPVGAARAVIGDRLLVGVSTHSVEEARRAVREGADYIGVGPVFPTATKDAGPPLGPAGLAAILETVDIPAFAIGGIGPDNAPAVAAAGCRRAAVSSAILAAGGPREIEAAARAIISALRPAPHLRG